MCKIIISTCCIHNIVIKCDSNERSIELFRQGDVDEVALVRDETFFSLSYVDVDAADKRLQICQDHARNKIH